MRILPGAEAWSAPDSGATGVGVLCVHGFPGSPASLRPLAKSLAAAGYAVELPRLPGHGTRWQDLARTRWPDWAAAVAAAHADLASRTRAQVVVGLSNGGALALHLAAAQAGERDAIAGLVLVNPAVDISHPLKPLLPLLRHVVPAFPARAPNDIARPGQDEVAYRWWPLHAGASVLELFSTVRSELHQIEVPIIIFTSLQDHVVDPGCGRVIAEHVSSLDVEQVWLERSYHVATLDYDQPKIEQGVSDFVRRVTHRDDRAAGDQL